MIMLGGTNSDVVAGFVLPTWRVSLVIEVTESLSISSAGCSSPNQRAQNLLVGAPPVYDNHMLLLLRPTRRKFIAHGTTASSHDGLVNYDNSIWKRRSRHILAGRVLIQKR